MRAPILALALAILASACGPPTRAPAAAPSGTAPSGTAPSAATLRVSPAAAAWRRITDIPTARSEVASTVFRESVYVIGGFGGGKVVELFDGQRWSRGPDLPIAVDHAMAGAIEDGAGGRSGVYVFGGNAPSPVARAFRLSPGDDAWREVAPMPSPRSQAAAVARGTSIFIVGGFDGQRLVAPTFVYDANADRWRTSAAIPTPRDHLAAALLADRICAVGGRRLSLTTNLATLECYEPGADRWEKRPDAPTARGGVGAATVGDRLVFVGGEQNSGTFKEVEIFDAATGRWSRGPDLPTPRHGIGVVAARGTLYVMSGGPTPGGSQTAVCEALDLR